MSTVTVNITIESGKFRINATIQSTGDIPTDLFLYQNTGTGLGEYFAVCTFADYSKTQKYQVGIDVPIFGNKFLRHTEANIYLDLTVDVVAIKNKIIADIKTFRTEFLAANTGVEVITL